MMLGRFKALNADSSEESDVEGESPTITKEALEEKAMAQYMEALRAEKDEKWDEAEEMFRQLLESDIIVNTTGRVTFIGKRIKPSLAHLKYCCYMNLGHVLIHKEEYEEGLQCYQKAIDLDGTDLNLWYKIAQTGMKMVNVNLAISAFQEVLEINPNHWPSLDTLVTAMYAEGGHMNCLYYISQCLQRNPRYRKGLALKHKIFTDHPTLKIHYNLFHPNDKLDTAPLKVGEDITEEEIDKYFQEVIDLRERSKAKRTKPPEKIKTEHCIEIRPTMWCQLARILLNTYAQFEEETSTHEFFRPVNLISAPFSPNTNIDLEMEVEEEIKDQSADEEVDKINNEGAVNENEEVSENLGVRAKRRRSSPTYLEQWMSGKRRSARVRSTARKEEPSLAQTLADLLPPRYLPEKGDGKIEGLRWSEDSMDTMDVYRLFENKEGGGIDPSSNSDLVYSLSSEERERLMKEENYFGTSKETSDVTQFLNDQTGQTIVRMMTVFTEELGSKWNLHWPVNLPSLYIQIHKLHLFHNPRMTASQHIMTRKECDAMLLYGELLLNQWLCYGKDEDKLSPLGGSWFGGDFPSLSLGDIEDDALKRKDDVTLYCRFYWMAALMHLYKGGLQGPIWALDCLANYPKLDTVQIRLVNVVNHYLINKHTVELLFVSLLRKEVLDKVPEFYENEHYDLMIDVLSKALDPEAKALKLGVTTPDIDRQSQFSLLLEAYWQTKNFKECFMWGEVCIYEAFNHYRATLSAEENNTERSKWASVITSTLQGILACIDDGGLEVVGALDDSKTVRLVQTLTNIICQQIEGGESDGIETTAPWILLYYVIRHEEETNKQKHPTNQEEEEMPRSLYLLFTAHDYLGRRAWCCMDDAAVLYKSLTVLELLLKSAAEGSEHMSMLKQQLEQILYCLYGHPIKRNKPRYVQEHNVDGLALTWTRSYQVFNFLRPKELPTYDSSSRHSITADTEALFKRIIGLVPAECNPARLVDAMTQYIESSTDTIPENDNPLPTEMADIYYLIADHNFKNKTWGKALRYYLLDVCNSPGRVDSWACLALARGSQLETKLNSCDPLKSEADFLKRAMMSCRCYSTCLDLDPGLSTVWIEYGSFSYMVHSFCSRLLKQEQNLSLEMFDILEKNKEGMLETAFKCFTSANGLWYADGGAEVQDERWLHHYMLGKIAEKKQEPPNIYLQHYIKSMKFLHENNVSYPDHISYTSPQNLAVEALELYYRIHACILKFLEQSEEKPVDMHMRKLFLDIVEKAASGPFMSQTRLSDTDDARRKTAVDASEENRISVIQNLLDDLITQIVTAETVFNKRNCDSVESDSKRFKKSTESEKVKSETQNDCEEDDENDSAEEGRKASQPKSSESSSESSDSESTSSDTSSASSSDDDSDDSTSAVSDQEASQSKHETDTKVSKEEKEDQNWKQEQEILTGRCLAALQECVRRFPEHYKSLYRLAYFYFRSKLQRDPSKSKQLLLGDKGLFKDRRPNNFFNGVWRIPSNDIDRPGSFAAHMNRCVLLLMDLLRESKDSKMLLDLALQLKDTPEPDKKYLRDPEREELCREALSLSVQALRKKLQEVKTNTALKSVLMEAFKAYKRVNKAWPQRDGPFSTVMTDAYTKLKDDKIESGQLLDTALKFCSQELIQRTTASVAQPVAPSFTITTAAASAVATSAPSTFVTAASAVPTTIPVTTSSTTPVPTVPEQQANQSANVPPTPPPPATTPVPTTQKSPFPMVLKRPRGRPSNVSIRHPSPSTQQKQSLQTARNPVGDMAAFYRNLASLSDPRLLMQAASLMNPLTSAAMSLQSQWNYLQSAELLRQVQLAQSTLPSLQALKERPNLSVTPLSTAPPPPQPKPSTSIPKYPNPSSLQKSNQSSKASMSKSPSSFLSALQQLQQVSAASVKPSTSNVPVSSGKPPVSVLRTPQPATPMAGTSLVPPPRPPPQTTMLNRPPLPTSVPQSVASTSSSGNYTAKQPEMSLQQKLSAKRNKATASKDPTMVIDLDKGAASAKLSQSRNLLDIAKTVGDGKYTGTSSGLSISKVPTKPVQPDMKLMSSLSILPVTSIKNVMSSLSPKEITVTKVTPQPVKQSEPKQGTSRSNDSITVSVIDSMGSKKSADAGSSSSKLMSYRKPSSSKSENDVVSTLLSMGSNVTITPTVTTKTSTQTKQLPKTDLSIVPGRQQQPQQHQQQQPQQHQHQHPQQHQQQQLTQQQQKDQRSKSGFEVIVLDD